MLAVRRFCLVCQGDAPSAVRACADTACSLWPWRLPEAPKGPEAARAVLRAVRRQCLACAGSRAEVAQLRRAGRLPPVALALRGAAANL